MDLSWTEVNDLNDSRRTQGLGEGLKLQQDLLLEVMVQHQQEQQILKFGMDRLGQKLTI